MKCLKCGSENSANAKFCRGCGSGLITPEPVATVTTAPCPSCGQTNASGKKFCSKCGASMATQAPLPIEQPQQTSIKTEPAAPVEESKSCPKCGNSLKSSAKFCGKCGFNFEQKSHSQAEGLSKVVSEPVKVVEAIPLDNNTAADIKAVNVPPVARVDMPQAKSPVEQVRPVVVQPVVQKQAASSQVPVSEISNKRPSGLIAAIVLCACAMGAGAYWWLGLRQAASPPPVVDAVKAKPISVVVTPSPAAVAASEAVATPVVSETVQPAPAQSTVAPPVAKPAAVPAPKAHVAVPAKEPKYHASRNMETSDDRKLLNAIDQYLDKQK